MLNVPTLRDGSDAPTADQVVESELPPPLEAPTRRPTESVLFTTQTHQRSAGTPWGRIGALVLALAVITGGGIVVGKRLDKGHQTAVTTQATTTTTSVAPPSALTTPKLKWGPLVVKQFGGLPQGVSDAAPVFVGTHLLVVGGSGSAEVLGGSPGSILVKASTLPYALSDAAAFATATSLYVIGGAKKSGMPTKRVLRLPAGSAKAGKASAFVEPLSEAGYVSDGTSLLMAGGWTGSLYGTAVIRFTPGSDPTTVVRLPTGVRAPGVAVIGQTLYVVGGLTATGLSRTVYAVNLKQSTVRALGKLPYGVSRPLVAVAKGQLVVFGGKGAAGKDLTSIATVDPTTGTAKAAGVLPRALPGASSIADGAATLVIAANGKIYRLS